MKISVSNIAWEPKELEEHLKLLKDLGCDGVELAPSLLWPEPIDATSKELRQLKRTTQNHGLEIVGFHALFYNRPDLSLFKSRESFNNALNYIKALGDLCGDLGGEVLVFGSPRNRARNGRDIQECTSIAAGFFHEAAEETKKHDVFICIEPLDESDFITSSQEGLDLVHMVNHPHFRLHLDIKAMINNSEDLEESFLKCRDVLKHVHVGDPGLLPPGTTGFDHRIPGQALRKSGYNRYISIEMKKGFGLSAKVVAESVKYVKACYME